MSREKLKKLLCENLELLKKNSLWLERSYHLCKDYQFTSIEDLSEEQLTNLEALSSRFGRTIDLLIYKVLRNLDIYELESIDNKLDIVVRAEKRGFVDNFEILIEMKDLRNRLVHEYIIDISDVFKQVLKYSPDLLDVVKKVENYIKLKRYCL